MPDQEFALVVSSSVLDFVSSADSRPIYFAEQFAPIEASYNTVRLLQIFKEIENRDPETCESLGITCTSG